MRVSEKRFVPRYDIEIEVMLIPPDGQERFRGVCINVSEAGALVVTNRTQPRGTLLRFESRVFGGTGEVIWTQNTNREKESLVGIRFVSLARKDRLALERLLSTSRVEN